MTDPVLVIAEAGVNHNGSLDLALQLVDAAADAGADAVKFQTFKAEALVRQGAATAEYQQRETGATDQFTMLKALQLSENDHREVQRHCERRNIEFMSTPFDLESADFLLGLGMARIKVPSGELTNLPFIRALAARGKPLILSTGMSTMSEVEAAVAAVRAGRESAGLNSPLSAWLTVLHCTSNYPAAADDVNLRAMATVGGVLALPVGYSDHTNGIEISIAAVALGARVIEKHMTLDRTLPGPDHKASLEPGEFAEMVRSIRHVSAALGDGVKVPRPAEMPIRTVARRSVTLVRDVSAGAVLSPADLTLLRPGDGIPPAEMESVVGRRIGRNLVAGTTLSWSDFE